MTLVVRRIYALPSCAHAGGQHLPSRCSSAGCPATGRVGAGHSVLMGDFKTGRADAAMAHRKPSEAGRVVGLPRAWRCRDAKRHHASRGAVGLHADRTSRAIRAHFPRGLVRSMAPGPRRDAASLSIICSHPSSSLPYPSAGVLEPHHQHEGARRGEKFSSGTHRARARAS